MASLRTKVGLLIAFLLAFSSVLLAQTATGEVNGTVSDPAGAAVSSSTVRLINQSTRIESQTQVNQNGNFIFINVAPGKYVLRVEAQGFKSAQTAAFDVNVNQTVTQAVALVVGEVSQTVEVTTETGALVEKSTTELGTVIPEGRCMIYHSTGGTLPNCSH